MTNTESWSELWGWAYPKLMWLIELWPGHWGLPEWVGALAFGVILLITGAVILCIAAMGRY